MSDSESESPEVEAQVTLEANNGRRSRSSNGNTKNMPEDASDDEDEILAVRAEDKEDENDDEDEEAEEDVYVISCIFRSNASNCIADSSWNLLRITCSTKMSV